MTNKISGIQSPTATLTAFWDDEACITCGAYVVESKGWWSEDGKGWYGADSDEDFKSTQIYMIGGPLDGFYNR
jgi:hypothetical protein